MSEPQLTLTVDGGEYAGWIQAEVHRSLDRFAHSFDLTYVDRWADDQEPWPIRPGVPVQVKYGNHILVTGQVDCSTFRAEAQAWQLRAAGRSLTGDLVDCSAIFKTGVWTNKKLVDIANDLVSSYGLTVEMSIPDNTPIRRFTIEEGETVYDALDRLVRNRGFLPVTNPDGNISMVRLEEFVGVTVDLPVADTVSRELVEDQQNTHSQYLLRSQSFAADEFGTDVTVHRKFDSQAVTGMRHRPLVLVADCASDLDTLKRRAQWEQNVRYGRSVQLRYVMPGILDPRGLPWQPGAQYYVRDQLLGVEERLLCVSAVITVKDGTLETAVSLTRPEAFSLLEWPDEILNLVTRRGRPRVKQARVKPQQQG